MKVAIVAVAAAVLAWLGRRQLVGVLTRTTGTWVGTPEPPRSPQRSPATQAADNRSSAGASSLASEHGSDRE